MLKQSLAPDKNCPAAKADTASLFPSLPVLGGKKVSAGFDGGRISSDGGGMLLASPQARELCDRLAGLVPDDRDQTRVQHTISDMFLSRSLAIAASYEDADDLDDLRHDPMFKMAVGKTPDAKVGLVSQPTMSPPSTMLCIVCRATAGKTRATCASLSKWPRQRWRAFSSNDALASHSPECQLAHGHKLNFARTAKDWNPPASH